MQRIRVCRGNFVAVLFFLAVLSPPALAYALPLPSDPFDATERFALALRAPDGRLVEIQAKVKSPDREDLPAGELVAVLRYQVPAGPAPRSRIVASRPLPVAGLSATRPALVRFSIPPALAPVEIFQPRLKIFYRNARDRSPPSAALRPVKDVFAEEILFGSTAGVSQTALAPPAVASAGEVVFGPVTLMRARGAPATDTLSFSLADTTGPFLLQLTNGDPDGSRRVSSAVVTLNGQPVFRPRDFHQQVAGLERQIVLQPTNTLTVELRSAPGARVTVQIVRLDQRVCRAFGPRIFTRKTGKPVVEQVTFPLGPQLTGPFTLSLQSGDAAGRHRVDAAILTLNGQTVFSPSDFNEQVRALSRSVELLPTNTLTVELRGAPGDFLTLEITGFDNLPPTVRITSPLPGTLFAQSPIPVSGTVDDPTVSVVVIPQATQPAIVAPVAPDGTWTAPGVTLNEGENTIRAVATDPCGNQGEEAVTVLLRTLPAPPTVELCLAEFGPEEEEVPGCRKTAVTNQGPAGVFGTVSDPTATLTVQGEGVENFDGFFFTSVPLVEGLNTITATATDAFGQTGADQVTVTLDTVAPVLTLLSPADGTVTAAPAITLTGTIDDPTATILVDGTIPTVTDSRFIAAVPLEEGVTILFVDAFDAAFNFHSVWVTVIRDSQPPVVTLTAPPDGSGVTEPTVTLAGTIEDATTVSAAVTHKGITQAVPVSAGRFSLPLTLLPGLNTISVSATDEAGNVGAAELRVTLVAAGATTVTGRVIHQALAPLAGATVTVPFTGLLALTGPDGRFTLAAVPAGNESLVAGRAGYETRSVTIAVPPTGSLDVGDIALSPLPSAPGTIAFFGTIRDSTTGEPLAGVSVVLSGLVRATTGADGTFLLRDLAKSVYAVRFERAGYEAVVIPPQFYALDTSFRLALRSTTGALAGTIRATTGAPLPGALVTATTAGGPVSTTSGSDGRYTLPGLAPGALSGTVTKAGFAPASFSGTVFVATTSVLDVALQPLPATASLTGTVTEAATGSPLADATVTIADPVRTLTATTGADGRYTITGVTPGAIRGTVTKTGFAEALFSAQVEAGQTLTANAALAPLPPAPQPLTLTGRVTDASTGAPLPGATLTATSGTVTLTATSGTDGRYTIADLPAGMVTIVVSATGFFTQTIQATAPLAGTVSIDPALVPLPATTAVTGTVFNAVRGLPEAGVAITVRGTTLTATTDTEGRYFFANLATGVHVFAFEKAGFVTNTTATVTVAPQPDGHPAVVNFAFPFGAAAAPPTAIDTTVSGIVQDALTGRPLPGATLYAGGITAVADAEGRFTLAGLPPGTVGIAVIHSGYRALLIAPTVTRGGSGILELSLPPATRGVVSGTVTDAATGAPLRRASVTIQGSAFLGAATDGHGAYDLAAVPEGLYTLAVSHPEYLPTTPAGVSVTDQAETRLDVSLVKRPTTGSLMGIITRAETGQPLSGVLLSLPDGPSTATAPDGTYTLGPLPAGLVTLALAAPGLPATTRSTAVAADPDPFTPTPTRADFTLDAAGTVPDAVTVTMTAATGGSIATPDHRFRLDLPPGALTADARVTLRSPASPIAQPGDALLLDPALGLSGILALGPETEILLEPALPGGEVPRLLAPVLVSAFYGGAEARALNLAEESLFPYCFDGTRWTVLQIAPHVLAVDRVNRLVVTALNFAETETGITVASLPEPGQRLLLAQAGGPVPAVPAVRRYLMRLAGAALSLVRPTVNLAVVDLAQDPETAGQIHANALPLLVLEGWTPRAILLNIDLTLNPLGDARHGRILTDLLAGTRGVYRPLFVTYNSRAHIRETANALFRTLHGRLGDGVIQGLPNPFNPTARPLFAFTDGLGYSMGNLVARAYQLTAGTTQSPLRDLVSLAGPHHGGAQLLQDFIRLTNILVGPGLPLELVLSFWSPGTANILDYVELPLLGPAGCLGSGNPFLCTLNRAPGSTPLQDVTLIAGTDPRPLAAPFGFLTLGDLLVGERPNDGVVPERSAFGKSREGVVVPPLAKGATFPENFNHLDVGKDIQPIQDFSLSSQ